MRFACVDFGDKRTGIAVGDDVLRTAMPAEVVHVARAGEGDALVEAVARAIEELLGRDANGGVEGVVVVGLPLNMDGTDSGRTKIVRGLAERLGKRLGVEVVLHDERQSTMRADELMAQSGLTHKQKKARRDAIAAAAILQDCLDQAN